jgi:uncharacterized membrane protein
MNPSSRSVDTLTMAFRRFLKNLGVAPYSPIALSSTIWFAPALAFILVLAIGCWLAAALNIWIDEAYTIHTTGRGMAYALEQTSTFELQPPFYFLTIAAWRLIDEGSIPFARFPSVAFAAAAAAIVVVVARRVAPRLPPVAVAVATALNPIVVWAAVEMRVYALVILIASTLTLAYIDGYVLGKGSRRARIWYVVAGIVGLYTQFYIGFILLAFLVALVALRRSELRSFLLVNAIIGVAFLPFVPVAIKQIHSAEGADVRHISLIKAIHEMFNASFVYILPHEIGWSGAVKLTGFLVAGILAAVLVIIGRPRLNHVGAGLVLSLGLACLVFSLAFAFVGEAPDIRRHAIAIAPLSFLCACALLSGLRTHRRALLISSALVYSVFTAASFWWLYRPPLSKTGDWQRVAQSITATEPMATIVIFPSNLALALGRYLPPQTRVVPFPQPMKFSSDYLNTMKLRDEAQVARSFQDAHLESARLWVVSDNSCDPGPQAYDFSCHYLESYLRQHYITTQRHVFHGAVATLYERTPDTTVH